jgi:outer membrane lipoprotein-sorting protein
MKILRNIFFLVFTISVFAVTADPDELLKSIRTKFDSINDFSAQIKQSGNNPVFSGRIFFRKGNQFRLELRNMTIVSDGSTIWNYNKKENKVVIDELDNSGKLPFSLESILNEYPSKSTLSSSTEGRLNVLVLTPKPEAGLNFKSARLWINSEYLVEKVLIKNSNSSDFELNISEYKLNQDISDSRFRFDIPEGSRVIDLR